jgi:hypothetical protein
MFTADIRKWNGTPAIRHVEEGDVTVGNQLHRIKGWLCGPAGIVQWRSAIVISNLNTAADFQHDRKKIRVPSAAHHVQKRFPERVAGVGTDSGSQNSLESFHVVIPH